MTNIFVLFHWNLRKNHFFQKWTKKWIFKSKKIVLNRIFLIKSHWWGCRFFNYFRIKLNQFQFIRIIYWWKWFNYKYFGL
jgi:hypothetical protein